METNNIFEQFKMASVFLFFEFFQFLYKMIYSARSGVGYIGFDYLINTLTNPRNNK